MTTPCAFANPTAFAAAGGGARSTAAAPTAAAQELVLPPGLPPEVLFATTDIEFTAEGELDEYDLFHSQHRFAVFSPASGGLTVWDLNDISDHFEEAFIARLGDPIPRGCPHDGEVFDTIGADGERELRVLSQWRSLPDTDATSQRTSTVEIFNLRGELLQSRTLVTSRGVNVVFLAPPLHGRHFLGCRLDDHAVTIVDANDLQRDIATLRFQDFVVFSEWWRGDDVLLLTVWCRYLDAHTWQLADEFQLYSFDGVTAEHLVTFSRRALNDDDFPLEFSACVLPCSPMRVLIPPPRLDQPHRVYSFVRQDGAWRAVREKSFSVADAGGMQRSSLSQLSPCERFIHFYVDTAAGEMCTSTLSVADVLGVRDGGEVEHLSVELNDGSPQGQWRIDGFVAPSRGSVGGSPIYLHSSAHASHDGALERALMLAVAARCTDFCVEHADAARARSLRFIGADRLVLELDGGDRRNFSLASMARGAQSQQDIEAEALEQRTTHPQRGWFRGLKRPRIIYPCEIEEDEEFNLEYDEFLGREQRRNERRERERRAVRAAAGELTDEDEDENESGNASQTQFQNSEE